MYIYIYIYISKICLSKCLYVYLIYLNDTVLNVSDVKDLTVWRYKKYHDNWNMRVSRISKEIYYVVHVFICFRIVALWDYIKLLI